MIECDIATLISIFCDVDDFCKEFEPEWKKILIENRDKGLIGDRKRRNRQTELSLSEAIAIVTIFNEKVIGTISVIDIGHHAFELRDVFLDKNYRGTGFAKQLLDTVIDWSKEHSVNTIYLGTTLAFRAAHRFYEKNGFREISKEDMPSHFQPMDCDEKFYRFDV